MTGRAGSYGYLGSPALRGPFNGPLRAGRIEWWGFSEAHSAIYPLISPNLGKWSTDPSARNGMRDGPSKSTRHLGPPPPISLKFDREAAYWIRIARNRREPAPAAPLTAPILTRRAISRTRTIAPVGWCLPLRPLLRQNADAPPFSLQIRSIPTSIFLERFPLERERFCACRRGGRTDSHCNGMQPSVSLIRHIKHDFANFTVVQALVQAPNP